ncbi:MAG: alanine--tRNA ligase, partial [Planctomycetota bacterium]
VPARFVVDGARRMHIRRHHTATHLLHAALREVLGEHVKQAGSLVDPDRLRFDFSHFQALTDEEIAAVERRVNQEIMANHEVATRIMRQEDAIAAGAMALFGEKYGEEVRVVTAGFSTELCGGTHVNRTGDIGPFVITSEGGVAAGVRRIEALAGERAWAWIDRGRRALAKAALELRTRPEDLPEGIRQLQSRLKETEKELARVLARQSAGLLDELVGKAAEVNGVRVLAAELPDSVGDLRDVMDKAKAKLKSGVIVFGVRRGGKVQLIAGVTKDLVGRFHAGDLVRRVAEICGGRGGGKPEMAMAGGPNPDKLEEALNAVSGIIEAGG